MHRCLEPELMELPEQVKAYAEADFEAPHRRFIELLQQRFGRPGFAGKALDLGCGPGDISRRFAAAFPGAQIDALDGSQAMLDYAEAALAEQFAGRIAFIHAKLPAVHLPQAAYDAVISNSLLHHLPDPQVLWNAVKHCARPGAFVAVMDLVRPASVAEARRLVEEYAGGEPEILKEDFFASLLAAFAPEEIAIQLRAADLSFTVETVGDRHVFIWGFMPGKPEPLD